MVSYEFTSNIRPRGLVLLDLASVGLATALLTRLAGCQDVPVARQRFAELIAPRAARVVPASGASATAASPASTLRPQRPKPLPRWDDPRPINPHDADGYSLHM
ncbi:hypothetical protein BPMI_01907c [Candidatus Burkholderia pumila]|uniref:Uncharacterized protein n=1 Tax=Candidatus Burkholderia pumila TaxID=1090375 RepID=A0ABR5HPI3_9BURK|nr:hypothetical protein BPMI_01907c [Candidatus Burkholderia pumila]